MKAHLPVSQPANQPASTPVRQSVSRSKTHDRIFIKLYVKIWFLQAKNVPQPGKNIILGTDTQTLSKEVYFGVGKKFISLLCYIWLYMMHHSCLHDSAKTASFRKIYFSSYKLKCSWAIILQNFLNFNISKTI